MFESNDGVGNDRESVSSVVEKSCDRPTLGYWPSLRKKEKGYGEVFFFLFFGVIFVICFFW